MYKYGFFHDTTLSIEIVLADGDVVRASADENPDLFYGAAGTLGTLGLVTLLEVRLIESKSYVELTYHPVASASEAQDKMEAAMDDPSVDYVDGIMFALDRGAVINGRLIDDPSGHLNIQQFQRAVDPWFYIHADRVTRRAERVVTEAVPLVDYLFRYDRGAFWTGKYA